MTDDQMNACLQDRALAEGLVADYQAKATADGIDATPTFFIDGEKQPNAPTRSSPSSSTQRSGPEPRPALAVLLALALAACAPVAAPPPGDDAWCASRFEQLDAIDFGPRPALTGGFDFRQGLIAQVHQGRCLTFGDDIAGLETLGAGLAPRSAPGGPTLGGR